MEMTNRTIIGAVCAGVLFSAAVPAGAIAAGPSYDLSNRARIEQDIRRNYNNYNRNIPTSPVAPRIRERHLRDDVVPAPTGAATTGTATASCSYQYGRWKRTGSKYWRDRYYACAD